MEKITDINDLRKKKFFENIGSTLNSWNNSSLIIAEEFYGLLQKNPKEAIKKSNDYMKRMRNICPGGQGYESFVGGPNHDWTTQIINVLGIEYPIFEKEDRTAILRYCLKFLDGLRYDYSQNHVELIDEPWLVRDILISRPLYWCGFESVMNLLNKHPTWKEFSEKKMGSEFWTAYAITIPKYSSLDIRKNFYEQFPDLIDRTQDAIAAIILSFTQRRIKRDGGNLEESITESINDFDPLLHDNIRRKMKEENWIELE